MRLMCGFCLFYFQIARTPRNFPTIKIKRNVERIEDFNFDDFEIVDYNPHPTIKMEMAV